ncbi:MAG TPA: helix-turn-helix domain-containing protein [Gemmatimonadales bacterium]|nr:helix-turn-helix domain-containing protein [Gemmatimonadales bacterium]
MTTVCTVLPPAERGRVDMAGLGSFRVFHCETVDDAWHVARRNPVDALLVSGDACRAGEWSMLTRFIREFPAIATIALVCLREPQAGARLLRLGAAGVRDTMDIRAADGQHQLCSLLARVASPSAARILAQLLPALGDAGDEVRALFTTLARLAPRIRTVGRLARHLQVHPITFYSRFRRAGLPSPKQYLAGMRLLHAADLFLNPALSIGAVAARLDYGTGGNLGAHVRRMLGVRAGEFRRDFPFARLLERYVERLIAPYRDALCTFSPLSAGVVDARPRGAARLPGAAPSPPPARRDGPGSSALA